MRSGSLVDAVQFIMADGTVKDGGYVTSGGDSSPSFGLDPVFTLSPDEHIKKIEVAQQDRLAGIRIVSTKGKVSQWYGTKRGERKTFIASTDNPIVGIEREAGGVCTRVLRALRLDGSALEPSARERTGRASGAAVSSIARARRAILERERRRRRRSLARAPLAASSAAHAPPARRPRRSPRSCR